MRCARLLARVDDRQPMTRRPPDDSRSALERNCSHPFIVFFKQEELTAAYHSVMS